MHSQQTNNAVQVPDESQSAAESPAQQHLLEEVRRLKEALIGSRRELEESRRRLDEEERHAVDLRSEVEFLTSQKVWIFIYRRSFILNSNILLLGLLDYLQTQFVQV